MSVFGIILLIAAAVFIYIYNSLVLKRTRADNFLLYVTGFLKRRTEILHELLRALPEKDGKEFLQVQALAESYTPNGSIDEKIVHDQELTAAWKNLYAQLTGKDQPLDPEVKKLLERLERNGGYLITVRKEYNQAVKNLNAEIKVFPWSLLAKKMKISARTPWQMPEAEWYKPLKLTDFKD